MEIDELQKKAERGDAEAQYQLGNYYFKNSYDKTYAAQLYRSAAKQGYAPAQLELGKCYAHRTWGTGFDRDEAFAWCRKAAEQNLVEAQIYLGNLLTGCVYRNLFKGTENPKEALKWFTKAAEQGSKIAQYKLSHLYLSQNDVANALKWCEISAKNGYADAQVEMAVFCFKGICASQNCTTAVKWLLSAAENGDFGAQCKLGFCYQIGRGVDKDLAKAKEWYYKALESLGCRSDDFYDYDGRCFYYGDDGEDFLDLYYSLGQCYLDEKNYTAAIECFLKSATNESNLDNSNAQYEVGRCFELGLGIQCNLNEAMKWYAKAAYCNHVLAKKRIIAQYLKDKNLSDKDSDSICEDAIKWYEKNDVSPKKDMLFSNTAIVTQKVDNSTKQQYLNNNQAVKESAESKIGVILQKLQSLTGLKDVKQEVSTLVNLLNLQVLRRQHGLPEIPMSRHLVFVGNPGTGKTTVARILAEIYHQLGILSKGQLIEVDRSGLVAGYVGQTALKTQEAIQSALGGILFVDEAYTLAKPETPNDFGQEAIDTILKAMEDHRDDFVVIVAGYPDLMKTFINSNPGLKSRFNKYIYFQDYNPEELLDIFKLQSKNAGLILEDGASEIIFDHLQNIYEHRDRNFANGRSVRNYFERVLSNQANRLAVQSVVSETDLITLSKDDVINAAADTTM